MAETKRKISDPQLPDIQKCPRCGANVLIGDTHCTNCGYNLLKMSDRVRAQPPLILSGGMLILGIILALAAFTGMDGILQVVFVLLGSGLVVGSGLYYAADLLIFNADDRRKRNGKK